MIQYTSLDGVTISVGECAKENDHMTLEADAAHWWFHASGHPGAHVVARSPTLSRETKRDAALLAIIHSKVPSQMKMSVVDMCRVGDVQKKENSNHGEVVIQNAMTLTVFPHKITEKARLGRLRTA